MNEHLDVHVNTEDSSSQFSKIQLSVDNVDENVPKSGNVFDYKPKERLQEYIPESLHQNQNLALKMVNEKEIFSLGPVTLKSTSERLSLESPLLPAKSKHTAIFGEEILKVAQQSNLVNQADLHTNHFRSPKKNNSNKK